MSTLVVQDVTNTSMAASSSIEAVHRLQSSITPFKKVLKKEVQKKAEALPKAEKSDAAPAAADPAADKTETGKTSLKDIFKRASEKYDISYDFLVAVAKAESDFNTKCVSSAGAKGIMQIMPNECKEFGVTDPFDAEQNIMAAAKLLKAHLKKFDGNFTLAAAAYNAGSGTVKKYGGVPPYKETQTYVKRIRKFMSEGVTVPDRKVSVKDTGKYTGSGGSAAASEKKPDGASSSAGTAPAGFDTGKMASESDLEKILITVGTGEDKVTMTYGAYLRYLELGTTGVG